MTGTNREPIAVANTPFVERHGQFSPDGQWVAYETDESGRHEVVVQSFPTPRAIVHVSTSGGSGPRWSATGTEIYFVAPDGKLMAVPITIANSTLTPGNPIALFTVPIFEQQVFKATYAVAPNGRFLFNAPSDDAAAAPITLILNWTP
jgi:Tol biopolymer transport system component